MLERRCFVQFIHPGGEHRPDDGDRISWNRPAHRRKFLRSRGRVLVERSMHEADLLVWGEWEAQSTIVAHFDARVEDGPLHLFEPYYRCPSSPLGLQNTDPFVFGERFHYTGCRQFANGRPTQLRHLAPGSVILFGSCLHRRRFVLDTLFVVDRYIDHSGLDWRTAIGDAVPEADRRVAVEPWYANVPDPTRSHRLYFGATPDAPRDGMFSFFPCLPIDLAPAGFARPAIHLPEAITDTLNQGKRLNGDSTAAACFELWSDVVRQVEARGLHLGVNAELPPERGARRSRQDGAADETDVGERASC